MLTPNFGNKMRILTTEYSHSKLNQNLIDWNDSYNFLKKYNRVAVQHKRQRVPYSYCSSPLHRP